MIEDVNKRLFTVTLCNVLLRRSGVCNISGKACEVKKFIFFFYACVDGCKLSCQKDRHRVVLWREEGMLLKVRESSEVVSHRS